MPGISSGLDPKLIYIGSLATADAYLPGVKFPSVHTVVDAFYIITGSLTANTTDFLTYRMINGKTTGNQTTNLAVAAYAEGGASSAWTTMTARNNATNYTFSANHWIVTRYSEDGTVAVGEWVACYHAVNGNV